MNAAHAIIAIDLYRRLNYPKISTFSSNDPPYRQPKFIPFGIGINENKYDMKRKTMHSMPVSICLIFFYIYALQSNNNQLRPDRFGKKNFTEK